MSDNAIGGYFGWQDLAPDVVFPVPPHAFRSARSALAAFLTDRRPSRLWLPWQVCGAVTDAVAFSGTPMARYSLAPDRGVPDTLVLAEGEWVLAVDYLGLCDAPVKRLLARFPHERIIVDASQALFRSRLGGEAVLYSPRKTLPLPDGGWVDAPNAPAPVRADEEGSMARTAPMRLRAEGKVTEGYTAFQAAEASLEPPEPLAMSGLTRHLLSHQDVADVASRRRSNHATLARGLATRGVVVAPPAPHEVPLYTPLRVAGAAAVRAELAKRQVYSPTFWPDASPPPDDPIGRALRDDTLYLPCDQRYDDEGMGRVLAALDDAMTASGRHYLKD
ncbi:hypothetical protein ABIE56_001180 [Luteibacter sp. 621]|uniref:hypothetical protein n=1 Tax=Luteibacter sp. 621 TaxID=3373916 RepID=UPI003D19262D